MDALLKKATTNDDSPTPGYVFTELAKITHSEISSCERMVEWLFDRLKRHDKASDAAIKWKVLSVVKQVSRMGRFEFRRCAQKHADGIKACLQFRGPPDPLRGDEPYRRVRDMAKEALEAVYDSTPPPSMTGGAPSAGSRMTGISGGGGLPPPAGGAAGSSGRFSTALPGTAGYDPSSPMHAPPVSTGTMSGFGNYDPRVPAKTGGIMGAVMSAFTTAPPPTNSPRTGGMPPTSTYPPGSGVMPAGSVFAGSVAATPSYTAPGAPAPAPAAAAGGMYPNPTSSPFPPTEAGRRPGGPGGVWRTGGAPPPAAAGGAPFSPPRTGASAAPGTSVRVGGAAKDGKYERSLVEDVTAPGGVRPVPDKDKVLAFLASVKTLDMELVAGLLDERMALAIPGNDSLGGQGPNVAHKALAVVEAIAGDASLATLKTYIAEHCDVMLEVYETAEKASVRTATARALHALGVEFEERKEAAPAAAAPAAPAYVAPAPAPVAVAAPAPVAASTDDILGLTSFAPAPAPVAAVAAAPSMFGNLSVASAPVAPAPAPVAAVTDMFGNLSMAAAPAPAAPAPVSFTGMTFAPAPAPTPAPAPAPAHDMFASLMGAPTPAPAPVLAAPAPAPVAPAPMFAAMPAPAPAPPAPAPSPAGMPFGSGGAAPSAGLQQAMMMINQQIQGIMMQMTSPAVMSNPAMQQAAMAQLMQLQAQQQQLTAALTASAAAPAAPAGYGTPTGFGAPMGMGMGMAPMGMGMGMGMAPGGMMGGMQQQPQQPGGMRPAVLLAPAPAPVPAPAPTMVAKPADAFDFMSQGLGMS